jgi:hypothetical protein
MNNTRTRTLAIVAVLTAATLVVGVTFAAPTTTQSAFAWKKDKKQQDKYVMKRGDKEAKFMKMKRGDKEDTTYKKGPPPPPPPPQRDSNKTRDNENNKDDGSGGNNGNGNTVTVQINKQKASQSGWDNTQEQEGQNTICTHPESDASCVSEGSETPVVNNTSSDDSDNDGGHGGP